MENIIVIIHVLAAASLIGLILLQHGKGAEMGAAFGSGASGSLFGVTGSSNFLSRATAISVTVFFATSLALAYIASNRSNSGSVLKVPEPVVESSVAADAETPAVANEAESAVGTAEDVPN